MISYQGLFKGPHAVPCSYGSPESVQRTIRGDYRKVAAGGFRENVSECVPSYHREAHPEHNPEPPRLPPPGGVPSYPATPYVLCLLSTTRIFAIFSPSFFLSHISSHAQGRFARSGLDASGPIQTQSSSVSRHDYFQQPA